MGGVVTIDQKQFIKTARQATGGNDVIAVVKNNAYNHGLQFTVESFLEAGIKAFATTSMDEALTIRELSEEAMVFLMNPVQEIEVAREKDIHITLPSLQYYYDNKDRLSGVKVHLEYAGLFNRSGFENAEDIKEVIRDVYFSDQEPGIDIQGIWTHFGYADEIKMDHYELERSLWMDVLAEVSSTGHNFKYIHAQNSASYARDGLFTGHTHLRLGIALYGSRPYSLLSADDYVQSLSLKAPIIQIRRLTKGQKCGYGGVYEAKDDVHIAIVDIGYGDGILRKRADFDCMIGTRRFPIKALMMSHMIVEVDDIVEVGDEVVLYSNGMRIDEYTNLGVGANSEQLGALNYNSLKKVILNDDRVCR
ncbi:alanine racemase [Salinicoccus siamensis]|uniref:Alanine racemase n=1 Tax=Salinicoccus siamensis TaxID=381830 RepID=A0ABV5Z1C0_9STAP